MLRPATTRLARRGTRRTTQIYDHWGSSTASWKNSEGKTPSEASWASRVFPIRLQQRIAKIASQHVAHTYCRRSLVANCTRAGTHKCWSVARRACTSLTHGSCAKVWSSAYFNRPTDNPIVWAILRPISTAADSPPPAHRTPFPTAHNPTRAADRPAQRPIGR